MFARAPAIENYSDEFAFRVISLNARNAVSADCTSTETCLLFVIDLHLMWIARAIRLTFSQNS